MGGASFVVLMAEDNQDDIIATERAWKRNNIANPLMVVRDGEECLDYIHQRGKYGDPKSAPPPRIVILDLNMPKMGGLDVLKHIRQDDNVHHLPVIILTTSKEESDLFASYELGANAFIVKPVGFAKFAEAIKRINLFWELVEQPQSGG